MSREFKNDNPHHNSDHFITLMICAIFFHTSELPATLLINGIANTKLLKLNRRNILTSMGQVFIFSISLSKV
jgi:hypothetical protein